MNQTVTCYRIFVYFIQDLYVVFFWLHLQHAEIPRVEIKPAPQQQPKLMQWPSQILKPLWHKGILYLFCLCPVGCFCFFFVCLGFFLMATPTAYGSSQARSWIWATVVPYTTAAAMPDPLTHYTWLGIKFVPQQWPVLFWYPQERKWISDLVIKPVSIHLLSHL